MMIPDTKAIREAREAQGLTFSEAAKRAGFVTEDGIIKRQDWYKVESDRKRGISADVLYRMAKALRCRMEDLLIDEEEADRRDGQSPKRK